MIDTFSCIPFDLPHLIYKDEHAFKSFTSSSKKPTLLATAIWFFMLASNLHKVTSFLVISCKTSVTCRSRYVTSYTTNAFNSRGFYPVLGEITWGGGGRGDKNSQCRKNTQISLSGVQEIGAPNT